MTFKRQQQQISRDKMNLKPQRATTFLSCRETFFVVVVVVTGNEINKRKINNLEQIGMKRSHIHTQPHTKKKKLTKINTH